MKKVLICLYISLFATINASGQETQDVIIKNNLESLKVYNVEISSNFVFYQLTPDEGALIQKLPIDDVMIIRKADGSKIDPSAGRPKSEINVKSKETPCSRILIPLKPHNPVLANICSEIKGKNNGRVFEAMTPDRCKLKYRIISEKEHTLEVSKITSVSNYMKDFDVVIPETVIVNGTSFMVTEIGAKAFRKYRVKSCQFPTTLKKIGDGAFRETRLEQILLPEGLEEIGEFAFAGKYNSKCKATLIYIPTTIKRIGINAFIDVGVERSPRGYYQGRITCLPEWIETHNCTEFGIDTKAVEAFEKQLINNKK